MKNYITKPTPDLLDENGPPLFSKDPVNILIVDDLDEKILVYKTMLEELGQNLIFARSGEEALKLVLKEEFAVILLDVNMPGMNGFETASLIRQRKKSSHTPIIFLTAFNDEIRMAQGYASGAVDYLPTPVVPEILRAKVRVFIELSQMRRQAASQATERALRAAAEESGRRSEFLITVSKALARVQDQNDLLCLLARLPIPFLADRTVAWLNTSDDDNKIELKLAWSNSNGSIESHCIGSSLHQSTELKKLMFNSIENETTTILSGFSLSAVLKELKSSMESFPVNEDDQLAAIAVPISIGGKVKGAVILVRQEEYSNADISISNELISRAGVAFENAGLVEKIKDADKRKDEFLATLAHELRNPLAPIHNALNIMNMTRDPELCRQLQDTIERQVKHMIHLVDDLMDVSRINQGKIELRKERVTLKSVIDHAIETASPLLQQRSQSFIADLPQEDIWLDADAARISQIFSNLLNNASKYTDPGGNVEITVRIEEAFTIIEVKDNGIGIPPDKLSDIFGMFAQVDSSLERSHGGLGIGLTLVKSLVEMHGGEISAYSDGPQKGSVFSVRLPIIIKQQERDIQITSDIKEVSGQSLRILVVDDNEASAKTLGWMVELSGHEAKLAHDGPSAIEIARTFKPDIVLLDIGLPGMSGYEVCKAMRIEPLLEKSIFIAQTGWGQPEHRQRSQEAGFHHHLVKPIDMNILKKLLSDIST
ncbi:MAG: luxQ 2 [Alphaproteobacteria bacterium]|nr:luxQ 2 [Alphaproteobacteria bacterium]